METARHATQQAATRARRPAARRRDAPRTADPVRAPPSAPQRDVPRRARHREPRSGRAVGRVASERADGHNERPSSGCSPPTRARRRHADDERAQPKHRRRPTAHRAPAPARHRLTHARDPAAAPPDRSRRARAVLGRHARRARSAPSAGVDGRTISALTLRRARRRPALAVSQGRRESRGDERETQTRRHARKSNAGCTEKN